MTLFQEHMKYATDVLRIMKFMQDSLQVGFDEVKLQYGYEMQMYDLKFEFRHNISLKKNVIVGAIDRPNNPFQVHRGKSVSSEESIKFISDSDKFVVFADYSTEYIEYNINSELYTEESHFQDSLVYSPEELRELVLFNVLKYNTKDKFIKFSLYKNSIPTLSKILRYKDAGMIK